MKIGLLGHGVVGSGVRKIIDEKLTDETKNLEITRILVKDTSEITDVRMTTDVNDILLDPSIDVVVECMGGIEPARKYALEALEHGKHFVTSNKKMFASSILELQECAERNHVSLHYEATCGGGIPWIANIDRCKRVDTIDSLKGIFNGTTNYILSKMQAENADFEEVLKEAAAEMLLEAKGFENAVVNLTGETADVVVPEADLEDAKRAQIEDIIKRKTGIAAENIVITPLDQTEDTGEESSSMEENADKTAAYDSTDEADTTYEDQETSTDQVIQTDGIYD